MLYEELVSLPKSEYIPREPFQTQGPLGLPWLCCCCLQCSPASPSRPDSASLTSHTNIDPDSNTSRTFCRLRLHLRVNLWGIWPTPLIFTYTAVYAREDSVKGCCLACQNLLFLESLSFRWLLTDVHFSSSASVMPILLHFGKFSARIGIFKTRKKCICKRLSLLLLFICNKNSCD